MNRFTGSLLYKTLALILVFLLSGAAIFTGTCLLFFTAEGYFSGEAETYTDSSLCRNLVDQDCYDALHTYIYAVERQADYRSADFVWPSLPDLELDPDRAQTNFRFALYGEDGRYLAGSIAPGEETGAWVVQTRHLFERTVSPSEASLLPVPTAAPQSASEGELALSHPVINEETGAVLSTQSPALTPVPMEATLPPTLTATPRTVEGTDTGIGSLGKAPLPTPTPAPMEQAGSSSVPPNQTGETLLNRRQEFTIEGYLLTGLPVMDNYARQSALFETLYAHRGRMLLPLCISLLGLVLLAIYLCTAAGRHREEAQPRAGFFHRIWLELWIAAVAVGVFLLAMAGLFCLEFAEENLLLGCGAGLLCFACIPLLLILLLMTLAARIKTKTLLSSTFVGWGWRLLRRLLARLGRALRCFYENRRLLTRALFLLSGLLFLECLLLGLARNSEFFVLVFLLANGALLYLFCKLVLQGEQLYRAAERMQAGDFSRPVDTEKFWLSFKTHGIHLNSLGLGISRAVDARMKSERMKTDLITNVSHDLKTPLTSIVNYVDLLKKEPAGSEAAAEYIDVLDRQSQRLKKLAEDLVAASKASSGVLQVDLAPTGLVETAHQSLGEYEERFAAADLHPVAKLPENEVYALADGRLLWRVMDNLLSNAVKYSLPGTRVYVDLADLGQTVSLSVKNVSKEPLNIPAEELKERFVRGDASRSTSGSGLGLSIAESLMTCIGGTLNLSISGDLFTAELCLPKVG